MKLLKNCPLLVATAVVSIILSCVTFVFRDSIYSDYTVDYDSAKAPLFSVMMKGMADGVYPWNGVADIRTIDEKYVSGKDNESLQDVQADNGIVEGETETDNNAAQQSDIPVVSSSEDQDISEEADVSGNDISGNSEEGTEEGTEEETETYEFCEVTDDYFEDALFIGDSRTVGLSEYVEALDSRATFYAKVSLTIYTVMDKPFLKVEGSKTKKTVEEALSENSFSKIYIMLGLNEMGTGNVDTFYAKYAEVISRIRELQPDAIIYIQGIMHVTADKSDKDKYFNNTNINERNAAIATLANNQDIFYLDMNEAVDDENGNLLKELSFDDVHLRASSYERWHQYLLQHAIVKE